MKKPHVAVVAIVAISAFAIWETELFDRSRAPDTPSSTQSALVDIAVPQSLSANAKIGKRAFDANCAVCHGTNAVGQVGIAPPLVHRIYEPNHHADESFQRAVSLGVRAHHWPFGNMPPIDGLTRGDVKMIIAYVRELQRENGIQ